MRRVGILGGTFNPIHNAHLSIANAAYEQFSLDEVWFMPAGIPPHKNVSEHVSAELRMEMVEKAIKSYPQFQVCDIEVKKTKPCYSWETLKELHQIYGNDVKFYLIIGADSLYGFHTWKKPQKICKYADILVAKRPGDNDDITESFVEELRSCENEFGNHFDEIVSDEINISSTALRESIYCGKDVSKQIPESVQKIIKEHHLYQRIYLLNELSTMQLHLKEELKTDRYTHTLGVMYTAANLAFLYEYPYENAMVAGLLHDCAKCLSDEERIRICKENNIKMSAVEKEHPHLLHGKVGAYLAREQYGVTDEAIQHAITVHTTGCVRMSLLDKIIFVADYIEPKRNKAPRLHEIRRMAYIDLDYCVYMILEDTMTYLNLSPDAVDQTTKETFAYYEKKIKEREK